MKFFGAFTLLVLPLFLLVCIKMIQQGSFGKTVIGKILVVIFYINIFLAVGTSLYLLSQIGSADTITT